MSDHKWCYDILEWRCKWSSTRFYFVVRLWTR